MSQLSEVINDIETRQTNYDLEQHVAMANDMIKGASELSLNELKLLRLVIMQIKPNDLKLDPFRIEINELAKVIGVKTSKALYRDVQKMCLHLMKEVILIGDGNPKHKWKAFQWVSSCSYEDGIITIQLHPSLEPYLIGLKKWYTQYRLEDIAKLKTVYAIRLYELITMAMKNNKAYADKTVEVYIDIATLRKATNTEKKYDQIGIFKLRVLDSAIADINNKSSYHITYRDHKESRKISGFYFHIESKNTYELRELEKNEAFLEKEGQLELSDYMNL